MKSYKDTLAYKQIEFSTGLSLIYTGILLFAAFDFSPFTMRPLILILASMNGVATVLQALLVLKIRKNSKKVLVINSTSRKLAGVLLLSLLIGNLFIVLSSLYLLKKKLTTGYIYAVYMVLTDLLVIGVSSLNLVKAYVTNSFIPFMFYCFLYLFSILWC